MVCSSCSASSGLLLCMAAQNRQAASAQPAPTCSGQHTTAAAHTRCYQENWQHAHTLTHVVSGVATASQQRICGCVCGDSSRGLRSAGRHAADPVLRPRTFGTLRLMASWQPAVFHVHQTA